jgi:hypothetical protein
VFIITGCALEKQFFKLFNNKILLNLKYGSVPGVPAGHVLPKKGLLKQMNCVVDCILVPNLQSIQSPLYPIITIIFTFKLKYLGLSQSFS